MKKYANFAGMKMRFKPILPALMMIMLPAFLSAQIKVHPVAEYDFQFRYNTSSEVASPFHGISAGARVTIPTSNYFSFNLGLQYRYAFTNRPVAYYNIQKGDASISDHNIEAPVTFGVGIPLKNGRRFFIDLGPTASFNMYSAMKPSVGVLGYRVGESYNLHKAGLAQRWNLFGCGTLGCEFSDLLTVKAGYRFGFLNQGSETETIKIHSITAALIFNF
ncbi:MAG: hypothetical protein KBS72_05305 [Bacteroidales bacterium]|nr:hypothetical protein [Candidatus Cacconaster scatequi]